MLDMLRKKIDQFYTMLDAKPNVLCTYIFSATNITIRNKIAIIASCLNDKKAIDMTGKDPKDRNRTLKRAIHSLEQLIAKKELDNVH